MSWSKTCSIYTSGREGSKFFLVVSSSLQPPTPQTLLLLLILLLPGMKEQGSSTTVPPSQTTTAPITPSLAFPGDIPYYLTPGFGWGFPYYSQAAPIWVIGLMRD